MERSTGGEGRSGNYVLVVDDEPLVRETILALLRRAGHEAVGRADGTAGLAAIAQCRPRLLILDVMMPGVSGWDVLRQIRQARQTADLPVIMLTALADGASIGTSYVEGCDYHLTKPVRAGDLLLLVERVLDTRECARTTA